MKKLLLLTVFTLVLFSCGKPGCIDPAAINYNESAKKDDGSCEYDEPTDNVVKSGQITSDETWTSDNIYELSGRVVVVNGVTLTIEAGTIIKGKEGSGTLASSLVISKGGKIIANGTPTNPIIFTSVLDNIEVGQLTGTNLDENDQGLWGGLIILGDAPISAGDGDEITQIEGIPATDTHGAFGGNNPNDNSGELSYISIRYSGALIGAGNEINGLTLGGVGNGTTISNIEVVGTLDDGVEFFGGTVNVSNILVLNQGDDGIDIDMNYSGTVDGFLVKNGNNSDETLEVDGPEGSTHTNGLFTLVNGTTIGGSSEFKSKAQGTIQNVKLIDVKIRASYQNDCQDPKVDSYTNLVNNILVFNDCEVNSVNVYTNSTNDGGSWCPVPTIDEATAVSLIPSTNVSNTHDFNWSWSYINGKL